MKKLTREEVVNRGNEVHNHKYDYSKLIYVNTRTKVIIICPEHNEFEQTVSDHLQGKGCIECSGVKKLTQEECINRGNEVHNFKYDYSKFVYVNSTTKAIIICPEHGEYEQTPKMHFQGQGCGRCANNIKMTKEEYVEKVNKIHNFKYDYSELIYVNINTKVTIICPIHNRFEQTAKLHLSGSGCMKCAGKEKYTKESYVNKVNKIHNFKYDYSKLEFTGIKNKVIIICPEHDEFKQTAQEHLNSGCPKCSNSKNTSLPEQIIYYYLKQLFPDTINRDVSFGKELDIYIPELSLAIEYDGLRWHKDNVNRDIEKNIFFKEKSIDIIRIREKGLAELSDCYNIVLKKNKDLNEIEVIMVLILKYINEKFNTNYTLDINIKRDYITILEGIKSKELENSIVNTHPEIAAQWHPTKNGTLKPEMFTFGSGRKVWWLCEKGHEYFIRVADKVKRNSCPQCSINYQYGTPEFKEKGNAVHNNFYDYSKVEYVNSLTEVEIICPIHKSFFQKAIYHLQGNGCPQCGGNIKLTREYIIDVSNKVHNYKFDYSKLVYINKNTPVDIICPEHGLFKQLAKNHMNGSTCHMCTREKRKKKT